MNNDTLFSIMQFASLKTISLLMGLCKQTICIDTKYFGKLVCLREKINILLRKGVRYMDKVRIAEYIEKNNRWYYNMGPRVIKMGWGEVPNFNGMPFMMNITSIDLETHNIITLPSEFGLFRQLKKFSVSSCNLLVLPVGLRDLRLDILKIEGRYVTTIPKTWGNIGKIDKIYVNCRRLISLPVELTKIVGLEDVWIRCSLLVVPNIMSSDRMKLLDMNICKFPIGLLLQQLQIFSINSSGLGSIPTEIGRMVHLNTLKIKGNSIKVIPTEIGKLVQLKWLSFNWNNIEAVPTEIGNLGNLSVLVLSNNKLTTLPCELSRLYSLKWLALDGNNFECIDHIVNIIKSDVLEISIDNHEWFEEQYPDAVRCVSSCMSDSD